MPVSRMEHLDRIYAGLELLECDRERTSILTLVDGDANLFLKCRNLTEQSKFASRLCIQRKPSGVESRYNLQRRRVRISAIHNELRQHVPACDYVFGLEDDGVVRPDALARLLRAYTIYPFAGLISGVQIGRHGIQHLGLWSVDDVYEPTSITSLMPGEGVQEIDAAGMYAFLTKRDNYVRHEFRPFQNNDLGPDVEWTLALRQAGYKNYSDFDVPVEHRKDDGTSVTLSNTVVQQVRLSKSVDRWQHEILTITE
jgi:hypothetical protein